MAKVVVVKSAGIGELEQVVAGHRTGQCGVWLIEVEVEAIAVLVRLGDATEMFTELIPAQQ